MDVDFDDVLDIADAANQYAPVRPPVTVLGLAQAEVSDRAVGVYGRGMTQFVAIPLRDSEADPLREQLRSTPGADAGTGPDGRLGRPAERRCSPAARVTGPGCSPAR